MTDHGWIRPAFGRLVVAIGLLLAGWMGVPAAVALADTGQYTTASGESCSWFGSGTLYEVSCSGYSRPAGGYVSYSCSISFYGSIGGYSYWCHDVMGNSWSGQR